MRGPIAGVCLLAMTCAGAVDETKLVDLTHTLDSNSVYWPTEKPFDWRKSFWGIAEGGYWYASASFTASEHLGTHIDSPIHFGKDQATTDAIEVKRLVGPAVVIDVSAACARDAHYQVTVSDLTGWEKRHGRIPAGAIVLVRTGWSKFWPDRAKYLGSATPGDTKTLRFPGISSELAQLLVERKVDGVGIDTASLDYGQSRDFRTHQILNGAGVYGLENVANLERLPSVGATVIALPVKIKSGTGGPVRIIAILP